MKKLMLTTAALGTLIVAGPVLAADLPARMPYKAPPPPPVPLFSWSGCYIGGQAGGAWGHLDFNNNRFLVGGVTTAVFGNHSESDSTWLAGGQAGCQWQITSVVFGVEGDGFATDLHKSVTDPFFPFFSSSVKNDAIYDVTARLGWAWDRWLVYIKGGGAWSEDKVSVTVPGLFFGEFTDNFTRGGWTVGGGVEWAFWENWSAKIEYMHYDFGSHTRTLPLFVPGTALVSDVTNRVDTVKFGINWRWNWWGPSAPVVARY